MVRSVEPREVFEEGLHIPLMRFVRNGVADATLNELLRINSGRLRIRSIVRHSPARAYSVPDQPPFDANVP